MKSTLINSQARSLVLLSALLQYPRSNYFDCLKAAEECLKDSGKALEYLGNFKKETAKYTPDQLDEIYTRSFDLAPLCIPYISSYIYGNENFERGALMSNLADRYSEADYNTNGELPDHLAVILGFAEHFSRDELAELIEFCLSDAVGKMTEALKDADNPYFHLLQSIKEIIKQEGGRMPC